MERRERESIERARERTRSRTRNISFRRRGNSGKQILRPEFTIDRRERVAPSDPDSETVACRSRVTQNEDEYLSA